MVVIAEYVEACSQALSRQIQKRIDESRRIIVSALQCCQKPCVSWSGGKDSTVMLHMILQECPDILVIYRDCGATYPDAAEYIQQIKSDWDINLTINYSNQSIFDVFREVGLNNPNIEKETLKRLVYDEMDRLKAELKIDGTFIGVRKEESKIRNFYLKNAIAERNNQFYIYPMKDWRTPEIWGYFGYKNIDWCKTYEKEVLVPIEDRRLGVWAGESARTIGRWVWLKRYYPELWNKLAIEFSEVRGCS